MMTTANLTKGSIKALYNDDKQNPLYKDCVVQVINIKGVAAPTGTRYRYCVIAQFSVHVNDPDRSLSLAESLSLMATTLCKVCY